MNLRFVTFMAALVIASLGGFFFVQYGKSNYKSGYMQCIGDGAALATEAAEELKDVVRKAYSPSDIDRMLRLNGWMRDDNN